MVEVTPRKPDWLRVRMPGGERYAWLKGMLRDRALHTVCEEARCPNVGECWGAGTATIMILGDVCTRGCRFCAVQSGHPGGRVDAGEPDRVAAALEAMGLRYVVVTMVDRDDLPDGGAGHVARTLRRIRERCPELLLEALVGDFAGNRRDVETVVREGAPDVFAHNVEVVPSLQRRMRDARCSWERSIDVLRWAREAGARVTKSSLMVGCGERPEEVLEAMAALREAGVDVLTVGQYLQPTPKHAPVMRWVPPHEFDRWREQGLAMGFAYVAAGPLVRSSYRAAEAYLEGMLRAQQPPFDRYGRVHLKVV
ncbi:MAG: lipoyl synthase [Myxococcota bacterium]|nr:lipoyl synthase [Myxococcota bacterium]MDW8362511.1 lipoyl synthase [Myxococcales bacterium]